jgi:hypothetical protein
VSFLKDIKERLGRFKLKKEKKRLQRKIKASSLEKADTVGILYNATNRNDAETVKKFIHYLKEERKDVISLGFIDIKEASELTSPILNYMFFDQNDLSKNLVPIGNDVSNFINKPFSILIDLNSNESCFPLEYISSLSTAKFKVGANGSYRGEVCDLVIDINKNPKLDFLIIQVKHYLKMINN